MDGSHDDLVVLLYTRICNRRVDSFQYDIELDKPIQNGEAGYCIPLFLLAEICSVVSSGFPATTPGANDFLTHVKRIINLFSGLTLCKTALSITPQRGDSLNLPSRLQTRG